MTIYRYTCGHASSAAPWPSSVKARAPYLRINGTEYRPVPVMSVDDEFPVTAPAGALVELAWVDLGHDWEELGPPRSWLQFEAGPDVPLAGPECPAVRAASVYTFRLEPIAPEAGREAAP